MNEVSHIRVPPNQCVRVRIRVCVGASSSSVTNEI